MNKMETEMRKMMACFIGGGEKDEVRMLRLMATCRGCGLVQAQMSPHISRPTILTYTP